MIAKLQQKTRTNYVLRQAYSDMAVDSSPAMSPTAGFRNTTKS